MAFYKNFTNLGSLWILFYWICISQNGLHASITICRYDEIIYFNNGEGKYSCGKCQNCPAGSILGYVCGPTTILKKPILDKCIPCNSDPNNIQYYSPGGYLTTCNKCNNTCGVNEIIAYPCTLSSNTRCRCKSDFYRDHEDGRCIHQCEFCPFEGTFYLKVKECIGNPNGKECRARTVSGNNDVPDETNNKRDPNVLQSITIFDSSKKKSQSITFTPSRTVTVEHKTHGKTQGIHHTPSITGSNITSVVVISSTSIVPSKTRDGGGPSKTVAGKKFPADPIGKANHLPGFSILLALLIAVLIIAMGMAVFFLTYCIYRKYKSGNRRKWQYSYVAYENHEVQQGDVGKVLQTMGSDEHLRGENVTKLLSTSAKKIIKLEEGTVREMTDTIFTKEVKEELLRFYGTFTEDMDKYQMTVQLGLHHVSSIVELVNHINTKLTNYTLYQFLKAIKDVSGIKTIVEFYKSDVLPANHRLT